MRIHKKLVQKTGKILLTNDNTFIIIDKRVFSYMYSGF